MKILLTQDSGRLAKELKQLLAERPLLVEHSQRAQKRSGISTDAVATASFGASTGNDFSVLHAGLTSFEALDFDIPSTPLSWIFITSARTIELMPAHKRSALVRAAEHGTRFACVGQRTEMELCKLGIELSIPSAHNARSLLDVFLCSTTAPEASAMEHAVWLPGSQASKRTLAHGLQIAGYNVIETPVYRPYARTESPPQYIGADVVVVTSGSAARAYAQLNSAKFDYEQSATAPVIALGEQTAQDCEAAGLSLAAVASSPDALGIYEALKRAFEILDFSKLSHTNSASLGNVSSDNNRASSNSTSHNTSHDTKEVKK
ncbi:uroporphyrinogen-III synthase [Arcanobacterium bovis]|uniref:Uroporphyrinogen-III synthase n=1 Tax=Arcanobacterium bovis TaxID=2529275 RepID=A0A4Q9V0C0_9ACTO|nr:uroporphyrinogen-III synthase [Arcanobacterium bovis]TBW22099.1 uroporphyrinogen-III synthase [Arcanobacterium bovis]